MVSLLFLFCRWRNDFPTQKRKIAYYFSLGAKVISWLIRVYTNVPQAPAIPNTASKFWVVSFEDQKHHVQMPKVL
jgi:hypothetical protein